jgi:hypothetical protein
MAFVFDVAIQPSVDVVVDAPVGSLPFVFPRSFCMQATFRPANVNVQLSRVKKQA